MEQGTTIATFQSKKGHDVMVRYPKITDLEALTDYASALADEDTFIELSNVTKEGEQKYLTETLDRVKTDDEVRLFTWVGDALASVCGVVRHKNRQTHVGEVDIAISAAFREEGIGSELFKLMVSESKRIHLKLLRLYCYENNSRAIHVYEKMGFHHAGVVPGAIAYKGRYVGQVFMYLPLV